MTDMQSVSNANDQAAADNAQGNLPLSVNEAASTASPQSESAAGAKPAKTPRKSGKKAVDKAQVADSAQALAGDDASGAAASAGSGGSSLYFAGGAILVGGGVAMAAGGGSKAPQTPPDTTPPAAPTVALFSDTGTSAIDRITSNGRIDVSGIETGASWEYSINGGTSWQAGSGGSFIVPKGSYADGAVIVRQKDAAGNVSPTAKLGGALTIDANAPAVPVIASVTGDGIVSAVEKEAGVTISGTAEAGSSVAVTWGSITKTVAVSSAGAWSAIFATSEVPADGSTTVKVIATDAAGNASAAAQQTVSVATGMTVSGQIVAGPLVNGHGLTVNIYSANGTLLKSGVAVDAEGRFSAMVAAKLGDVVIVRVADADGKADYLDEATGASKDLNAALFAAVKIVEQTAANIVQINPLTTLAAIKAGLAVDGTGSIATAKALSDAAALIAKAFGVSDISTQPIPTNSTAFSKEDGLSDGEKLGIILATLSGMDQINSGDAQATLAFLAEQLSTGASPISEAALIALMSGAMAAGLQTGGDLASYVSDMLHLATQTANLSIDPAGEDNLIAKADLSDLEISGTVAEGATAVVLKIGGVTANAVITGKSWSYTLSAEDIAALGADGSKLIIAKAELPDGSSVSIARAVWVDATPPAAPTIDAVATDNVVSAGEKAAGIVVTGTAEAGASVQVTWGGKVIRATADALGHWSVRYAATDVPADGSTMISATARDAAGNLSDAKQVSVSIDSRAPAAPTINAVSGDDILGSVERSGSLVLSGTAEAGAAISLRWGSGRVLTTTTDGDGNWSITVAAADVPGAGISGVTVTATDAAGNLSAPVSRSVALYDSSTNPIILSVSGDDVINNADGLAGVTVRGLAPADGLLRISWGTRTVVVQADSNGDWSALFALGDLPADGPSKVDVLLVTSGGEVIASAARAVTIDTTAPGLVRMDDVASNNVVNFAEKSSGVVLTGSAEAGSTVEISWGGTTKTVTAGTDGKWTAQFSSGEVPSDGTTEILTRSSDAVGNFSLTSRQSVTIDTAVPLAPQVRLQSDTGSSITDLITSDGTVRVSGIESGAVWSYSVDGGQEWITGSGSSFVLTEATFAANMIRVRQEDAAGNISETYVNAAKIIVDSTAADLLIDADEQINSAEKAAGVTVTGSFEAGGTVVVSWGATSKTVVADSAGAWTVTFDSAEVPTDGVRDITATGTDTAGNTTTAVPFPVLVDSLAPAAPSIALVSDTGSSLLDGITNDGTIAVSGLEVDGNWEYSYDGGATWRAGTGSNFLLGEGRYDAGLIRVRQIDNAGNVGTSTTLSGTLVVDLAARGLTINQVAVDGVINSTERAAGISVTGVAEAGATVDVTWGSLRRTVTAGSDGQWLVNFSATDLATLAVGSSQISAQQTDLAGNLSTAVEREVSIDLAPPPRAVINTVGGDDVINAAEKALGVVVAGTAVANGTVRVVWGATTKTVIVDASGNWSTQFAASEIPSDGSTNIQAFVTNAVGNVSAARNLAVLIDTTVAAPTILTVANDGRVSAAEKAAGVTITGTSEAGASIDVKWGAITQTVVANSSGQWSATFAAGDIPADGETIVSAVQTDKYGNKSDLQQTTVTVDTRAPNAPIISAIAGDDIVTGAEKAAGISIGGVTEANARLTVNWGTATRTATADALGNWTVSFASSAVPADGDSSVTVVARDVAGNVSATSTREITVATAPLTAPIIAVIATDNIISAAEKSAGVRVTGIAAASSVVTVSWGGVTKNVVANSLGSWTASFGRLEIPTDGTYAVTATALGLSGSRQVLVDADAPAAPLLATTMSAQNAATATGLAGAVTVTAEAGSSVTVVFQNGTASLTKTLTGSGISQAVQLSVEDLASLGNGVISVTATATGLISGKSAPGTASFVLDTAAPIAPALSAVATDGIVDLLEKSQGVKLSGTGEGNASISVQWGSQTKSVIASATGEWSVTFAAGEVPADGTAAATIIARDAAGNTAQTIKSIDVLATPHLAISRGDSLIVTNDMLALSANATAAASVSFNVSAVTHGEFRNGDVAVTSFTLSDVQLGNIRFVHDGTTSAPTYSLSITDGTTTSVATVAHIAFAGTAATNDGDVLAGTALSDLLIGGNGNDVISGAQGNDILYGHGSGPVTGSDNDVFVWNTGDAGTGAVDVIRDFKAWNGTEGDKIDLVGLLVGYAGGGANLAPWVTVQTNATLPGAAGWDAGKTGTLLTIDIDGSGSGTVSQTIFLSGVTLSTTNPNEILNSSVILA